jgi:hypothetical protein
MLDLAEMPSFSLKTVDSCAKVDFCVRKRAEEWRDQRCPASDRAKAGSRGWCSVSLSGFQQNVTVGSGDHLLLSGRKSGDRSAQSRGVPKWSSQDAFGAACSNFFCAASNSGLSGSALIAASMDRLACCS